MTTNNIEEKLTRIEKKLDELSQDKSNNVINVVARVLKREKSLALLTSGDYLGKLIQWWHLYEDSLSSSIEDEPLDFLSKRKVGFGLPPMIDFLKERTNRFVIFKDQYDGLIAKSRLLKHYYLEMSRYKEELEKHISHLELSKYEKDEFSEYFEYYGKSVLQLNEYLPKVKKELENHKHLATRSGFWGKLFERKLQYQEDWNEILELVLPPVSIDLLHSKLNDFDQKLDKRDDHIELSMFLSKIMLVRKDHEVGFITENYYNCSCDVQFYLMIDKIREFCVPQFY